MNKGILKNYRQRKEYKEKISYAALIELYNIDLNLVF